MKYRFTDLRMECIVRAGICKDRAASTVDPGARELWMTAAQLWKGMADNYKSLGVVAAKVAKGARQVQRRT